MPALPFNLDDLLKVRGIETSRIEFKSTWDEYIKEAVTKTVCAFANDLLNLNGGYIVLGIKTDDGGNPVLPPHGLEGIDLDKLQKEIRGQCKRISPEYQPVIFPEVYLSQSITIIWAPGGDNRPYEAPKSGKSGERAYYVRQGAETVEAQGDIRRQLLERAAKIPFDDRRNQSARIEDLSPILVRRFLADIGSDLRNDTSIDDHELYKSLRLTAAVNSHDVPRNVGLLFFNEDPEKFFPGSRIEIVQFSDDAGGNLIEEKTVRGPLHEQLRQALQLLDNLTDAAIMKIPGQAVAERFVSYPYEAMEESLVNAVYHRGYDYPPEPVKICLYPDRLEIISYPGPVPGLELAQLNSGKPIPLQPARNRRIGELLKALRLAESWGTGIPKIRRKMRENGSPEPSFDFDPSRTYFRVVLPAHPRYQVIHALRESAHLWAIGERRNALAHLERAYDQQSTSGALAGQIIEYAGASDDIELARRTFEKFNAQAEKEGAQPYLRFAKMFLDRGDLYNLRNILGMVPATGSYNDLVEAAILRKKARDFREAHQLFSQIHDQKRDDPKFVHEFAQTKLALAKGLKQRRDLPTKKRLTSEAVELLHRAIQLTSDPIRRSWCWHDLAKSLAWLREPASNVEHAYLQALALNPDEPRFKESYEWWKKQRQEREERHSH